MRRLLVVLAVSGAALAAGSDARAVVGADPVLIPVFGAPASVQSVQYRPYRHYHRHYRRHRRYYR